MRKHVLAGALAAAVAASGAGLALLPAAAQAAPSAGHRAAATGTSYAFTTLDDQADPTFNQLLGINVHNVIAGYFGSGNPGHPNKGYQLTPPYGQGNYVNENFPGSAQTQVTSLNNLGDSAGFWVTGNGTNHGFIEWNGVFTSYNDPSTPHMAGSVNQILGINNSGEAVGFYNDKNGNARAFRVNQGTGKFAAIDVPGTSVTATGVNTAGDVVGISTTASVTSSWLKIGSQITAFQYPGGSDTQAFGINSKNQIVGSYLDGSGVMHGFVLSDPTGPHSMWQSIDDPNGVGSTVVNGINANGDLVGFYTDAAGNVDGMLATPTVNSASLNLMSMPQGTATLGRDGAGNLTAAMNMFGLTPGSAHRVELMGPSGSGVVATFGTLTADGVGQAAATLDSTFTGSIPSGSTLAVLNGTVNSPVDNETIAHTASLSGSSTSALPLTAVEVAPNGTSYGTPAGTASLSYNTAAKTLTVTVNASGLTPGMHAAHIHFGSCQNQGPVVYMLMDLSANSAGKIVNETRVLTGVTSAIPVNNWYLNIHQGNSNNILKNGAPTILFRPLLCANA